MKKIISLILVLTMVLASFIIVDKVYANTTFSDVKSNDWFYSNVTEMVDLGIIDGYPDGTFNPQGAVTVEQFLKMTLIGLGYGAKPTDSSYWADGYIQKAEELKIVDRSFISDYRLVLTREQTAKIIANVLSLKEERPLDLYYEHVKPLIKDLYTAQDKYKEDIVDCYVWGIMQGDNYKLVNPQKSITRAETTAVILRMINKERRIALTLDGVKSIEMETVELADGLLVAPKYKGVVLNEMIDLVETVKAVESNTLGVENAWLNPYENAFGIAGFENQRKLDEWNSLTIRSNNGEINQDNIQEEIMKVIYHKDWELTVSTIEFQNKRMPYKMFIWNHSSTLDDKKYNSYNSKYDYNMAYYKKTFQAMFKIWFEDEFDKAWKIFDNALKNTSSVAKSEEIVINNRNFFIAYDNGGVNFSISLKLK